MSSGFFSSRRERIILSVRVAVFPEPAAALTSRVLSLVSIAESCSFWSVGYIDCKVVEKLPDDIYEDYEEQFPEMFVCPYYEEQEEGIEYDYPSEE